MKICSSCGGFNSDAAEKCSLCGKVLATENTPAEAPAPAAPAKKSRFGKSKKTEAPVVAPKVASGMPSVLDMLTPAADPVPAAKPVSKVSSAPSVSAAAGLSDRPSPVAAPVVVPVVEEPVAAPVVVPVEDEPIAAPVAAPVEDEPVAEPVAVPVVDEPVAEPMAAPVVEEPVAEPMAAPVVDEPVAAPVVVPVVEEPVAEPVVVPVVDEPVAAPVAAPVVVPVVEEPIAAPAAQPVEMENLSSFSTGQMLVCPACSAPNELNAETCILCGKPLKETPAPVAVPIIMDTDPASKAVAEETPAAAVHDAAAVAAAVAVAAPEAAAPVEPAEAPEQEKKAKKAKKEKKPMGKGKKAAVALLISGGLVVGIAIAGAAYYFTSPALDVKKLIEKNKLANAEHVYLSELKGNKVQEMLLHKLMEDTVGQSMDNYNSGKLDFYVYLRQSELIASFGFEDLNKKISDQFSQMCYFMYNDYMDGVLPYDDAVKQIDFVMDANVLDENSTETVEGLLDKMKEMQDSRNAYIRAEVYYNNGNYAEALKYYRQVIADDDNYADAQSKIEKCRDGYRHQVLDKVANPTTTDEFIQSIAMVEDALLLLPADEQLSNRLVELRQGYAALLKQNALNDAQALAQKLDFPAALDALNNALKYNEGDSELVDAMNKVEAAYAAYAKELVTNCLSAWDYDTAFAYLDEACTRMPGNAELQALLGQLAKSAPTDLNVLTPDESNQFEEVKEGMATDVFGTSYSADNLYRISSKSGDWSDANLGYAKYTLQPPTQDPPFVHLHGTVVLASESSEATCAIEIYGDDALLYTSPVLSRESAPIRIDVSLENITQMEIRLVMGEGASEATMTALLSNFQLFQ